MQIYKRRWVRITIVTIFAVMLGFGALYNTVNRPFSARIDLTINCTSVPLGIDMALTWNCTRIPIAIDTDYFIMQALLEHKEALIAVCPSLHDPEYVELFD